MNNFEEWERIYKPIPNHIDKQGTYYADENGVNYSFETFGEELKYINKQDERYMRPADVFYLRGDATRAREELGWKPKVSFEEMISRMVSNDIKLLSNV